MHMEKSFRRSRAGRDKNFRRHDGSGIDRTGVRAIAQSPCSVMPGATDRTGIATRQVAGRVTAQGHAPVEVHSANGVSGVFAPPTRRERVGYAPVARRGYGGAGRWHAPVMRRRGGGDAAHRRLPRVDRATGEAEVAMRRKALIHRAGRSEIGHVGQYGAKRASPSLRAERSNPLARDGLLRSARNDDIRL